MMAYYKILEFKHCYKKYMQLSFINTYILEYKNSWCSFFDSYEEEVNFPVVFINVI